MLELTSLSFLHCQGDVPDVSVPAHIAMHNDFHGGHPLRIRACANHLFSAGSVHLLPGCIRVHSDIRVDIHRIHDSMRLRIYEEDGRRKHAAGEEDERRA